MKQLIEHFAVYLHLERNRSENTVLSYKQDLMQFIEFLEKEGLNISRPEKINQTNITAYTLFLERTGKTPATVSRNLSALKSFFRYLMNEGIVRSDPVYKLKSPKADKKTPDLIPLDEIELLMTQPESDTNKGKRDKAILETLFATGLKVSELISLTVRNVNTKFRYIECFSANKRRIVPIGPKAAQALDDYLLNVRSHMLHDKEQEILFVNSRGVQFTRQGLWKIIKHYAQKAGLSNTITPSLLRSSFALHMVHNGADMDSLKELLGHSDTSATQVYFKTKKGSLRDVYEKAHPRK